MRKSIFHSVLIIAAVCLALAYHFRPRDTPSPKADSAEAIPPSQPAPSSAALTDDRPASVPPADSLHAGNDATSPATDDPVSARVDELEIMGMSGDRSNLNSILADLTNPELRIREAARDAAVQFGSVDAIPALDAARLQLDDPEEKVQIGKAIEYLQLPSLYEAAVQP